MARVKCGQASMASNSNTEPRFPSELEEEHWDALIFCAECTPDDRNKAEELQRAIEGFSFDNDICGRAAIYDDAIPFGRSLISSLDDAIRFSTLLFAIYSKDLKEDQINWHTTNTSLWHTIENEARRETFIPVIYKDGDVLPAYAREKRPLDMRRDNWSNVLKKLINSHLEKRLVREREQEHRRSRYHDMSNRATNCAPPGESLSHHMFMPSHNQDGHRNIHRLESLDNIDVHGTRPHDIEQNGHGAPHFTWDYMRSLITVRRLGVLGFAIVLLVTIKFRARRFGT